MLVAQRMSRDWFVDYFAPPALDAWQRAQTHEVTLAEVAFLESVLLKTDAPRRLLDVPCGDGRHAVELAKLGHQVTGVDIAPDNAKRAQRRASDASISMEHILADMRSLPQALSGHEPFDGAYCWGNSFGYLPRAETLSFVKEVGKRLAPGARFVIDTATSAESLLVELNQNTWTRVDEELTLLLDCEYDVRESRLDTTYTSVLRGQVVDTRTAHHFIFTSGEIVDMLKSAGLSTVDLIEDLDGSEFRLGSERLIVVAERS
jgi:SAM-dependent methyltransferase